MGAKAANGHPCRSKEPAESRAFEPLVRKLVAHAKHVGAAQPQPTRTAREEEFESVSEEILFACEVDGVRCVLARAPHAPADALALSPREREIARMIAKGYPNKVIASVLDISVWTVATHLRRIFTKLAVTSRAAMVTEMFKHGLLGANGTALIGRGNGNSPRAQA